MKNQKHFSIALIIILSVIAIVAFVRLESTPEKHASPSVSLAYNAPIKTNKPQIYTSPAGIIYGKDPSRKFDTRIDHIMAHTKPDNSKPKHSIFIEKTQKKLLQLLDEAWKIRGPPKKQGNKFTRDVYDVNMNMQIGEDNQQKIRMVFEGGSGHIVTAYPVH